ncbi:hypothetical protein KPH14_008858 [Odynerus spinipes]|uniref:Uncharacterized protein n=1 Tax=Odynerus spinipes TaxID=1348599 RepID=A0AAD9R8P4_9HYME|nr:hypothetical protein KPH14_008858 [Odynerus spinipes]
MSGVSVSREDTLEEWKLVFYGTETSLEFEEDLDKDKPGPTNIRPEEIQDNMATDARQNVVDTEGDPWTGSQQIERVSHPEVQRPTTENQTSGGCANLDGKSGRCLECKSGWFRYTDECWQECPIGSYAITDDRITNEMACGSCHYSCLTCSGATDSECLTCHSDSKLLTNFGESQCVLQKLAWRMDSTIWLYWLTVFFSINLAIILLAMIYVAATWCAGRRNSSSLPYDYSKVAYSSNGDARKVRLDTCISDSE